MKNKLELYGTLGPSCCSKEILKQMFQAGMTGIRLNLSHTNLSDCEPWLYNLYEVSEEMRIVPDLLVDLQGPELRIGMLSKPVALTEGSFVIFHTDDEKKEATCIDASTSGQSCSPVVPIPSAIFPHLKKGQTLRLDDGKIITEISNIDKRKKTATATVTVGGLLSSRKSLAIDNCSIKLPTLTMQDMENLKVLRKYRVTGVMLPFVQDSQDLIALKKVLIDLKLTQIRIFAKIENQQGLAELPSLLPHCDQIVIARGDLGNSCPLYKLPAIQKQISRTCILTKTSFMVVTQMLASMEKSPVPTRAEVNDIFNAVLDGASSLMLTGETAVGGYPVEAMKVLCDTAYEAIRYRMEAKFLP